MVGFFVVKTMWVRFQKKLPGVSLYQPVWMEDDTDAIKLIKKGDVARVTGPEGISIEEDTPERVITQLAREEGRDFGQMEAELARRRREGKDRDDNPNRPVRADNSIPIVAQPLEPKKTTKQSSRRTQEGGSR